MQERLVLRQLAFPQKLQNVAENPPLVVADRRRKFEKDMCVGVTIEETLSEPLSLTAFICGDERSTLVKKRAAIGQDAAYRATTNSK